MASDAIALYPNSSLIPILLSHPKTTTTYQTLQDEQSKVINKPEEHPTEFSSTSHSTTPTSSPPYWSTIFTSYLNPRIETLVEYVLIGMLAFVLAQIVFAYLLASEIRTLRSELAALALMTYEMKLDNGEEEDDDSMEDNEEGYKQITLNSNQMHRKHSSSHHHRNSTGSSGLATVVSDHHHPAAAASGSDGSGGSKLLCDTSQFIVIHSQDGEPTSRPPPPPEEYAHFTSQSYQPFTTYTTQMTTPTHQHQHHLHEQHQVAPMQFVCDYPLPPPLAISQTSCSSMFGPLTQHLTCTTTSTDSHSTSSNTNTPPQHPPSSSSTMGDSIILLPPPPECYDSQSPFTMLPHQPSCPSIDSGSFSSSTVEPGGASNVQATKRCNSMQRKHGTSSHPSHRVTFDCDPKYFEDSQAPSNLAATNNNHHHHHRRLDDDDHGHHGGG